MKNLLEFTMEINEGSIDFRATLKKLMEQKKVSIAKLAREADLNYGTVYYFLNGKSQMRSENLRKLFYILLNKV